MSNAIVNGMAGAGGGIIAQIITYPLQTVNTRQQTERVSKKGYVPSPAARHAGNTLIQIFQVIKTEGLGGLYSGLKPSLIGTAASQGIYYSFYQSFKNKAEAIAAANKRKGRGDGSPGMLSWLIVAALAGSLNVLLTNPIWVLVTRMQTHTQAERKIMEAKKEALLKEASENVLVHSSLQEQLAALDWIKPRPYGTFQAASEVYYESGVAGFWKGIVPTLIMVCNPSIQFMIYESLLKYLRTKRVSNKQGKNISALEIFLVGALAKLGATVSTYPLLVVKSRLQAKQEIGGTVSLRYSDSYKGLGRGWEGGCILGRGGRARLVLGCVATAVIIAGEVELVSRPSEDNDARSEDRSFEPSNISIANYVSSNPGNVRENNNPVGLGAGPSHTRYASGHSETEHIPTFYASSSNIGSSLGSSSSFLENNDASGPFFGPWGSFCKRKALEGTFGQFYPGGSSCSNQPMENLMQHSFSGGHKTSGDLSISTGPLNVSPSNHSEQLNSRSEVGISGVSPAFFPRQVFQELHKALLQNFCTKSNFEPL